ncbi:flavohemoglobin expression-modulating QEGLA motif protein [Myxococcota bacterium]|nr:flavohemoglobin expression-modulating QEGLA motif protein [Myxococcota bacterium]
MSAALDRLIEQDRALYKLCDPVRVLEPLDWPNSVEAEFFAALDRGDPRLPQVTATPVDHRATREALRAHMGALDRGHPGGAFLYRTAECQLLAAEMMEQLGTPGFTARSRQLYGAPEDLVHAGGPSQRDAAEHLLARTEGFASLHPVEDLPAEVVADRLRALFEPDFRDPPLTVVLDPELAAKASASSTRVRLRADAKFSEAAVMQLYHHEAMVHAATRRNGKDQPVLRCLGLSTPRTTCAQEGLATLAELITDCCDVARLRRLALRVRAIDAALAGADFLEVYRLFESAGQTRDESYASAQRVFRGGDVRGGGIALTKDLVYIKGLNLVGNFMRRAIAEGRPELPLLLFAGRMTPGDAVALAPLVEEGLVRLPTLAPSWVKNEACLVAYLVWSAFLDQVQLDAVRLEDLAAG